MPLVEKINACLPQTQCQQCGYSSCLPYAKALAQKKAPLNLCLMGGREVRDALSILLDQPSEPIYDSPKYLAYIDEDQCIGCTACIRACPVSAILGTHKAMHVVIERDCTGCELCLPSCPIDCIYLKKTSIPYLPYAPLQADFNQPEQRKAAALYALKAYQRQEERKERQAQEKKTYLQSKENENQTGSPSHAAIHELLAQARKQVVNRKERRVATESAAFSEKKLFSEQAKAAYRKAQKDLRYGNEQEKIAARFFLKSLKKDTTEK